MKSMEKNLVFKQTVSVLIHYSVVRCFDIDYYYLRVKTKNIVSFFSP